MRHIADRFTAILDANVLYPFWVRDVLLSFAEAGLYRPRWTKQINDEWSRNILKARPALAENVSRTIAIMNRAFPEADVEGYEDLVDGLSLPDPDDRHVLAAAIRCGAGVIVTNNLKHFPNDALAKYDIEALSADDFALNTFQLYEADALKALKQMRLDKINPPYTAHEVIVAIIAADMAALGATLKPHIESI